LGDNSDGILAQSVGGGGGNGGENMLVSADLKVFLPDVPGTDFLPDISGSHTLSIGGTGGTGGSGGNVTVTNGESMSIATEGAYSNGILAQSVGGGGGNGGNSVLMSYDISILDASIPTEWKDLIGMVMPSLKGSYSSSIGGSGGSSGKGGTVDVNNFGLIETQADYSNGILAQSVGGGGGNGGYSETISLKESIATASIKLAPEVSIEYSSSVGGSGGDGGNGGSVSVANSGSIVTLGDNSNGILAQSVGGGGGNGGSSVTFSADQKYLNFSSPSLGISYAESIGGSGVSGGQGGAVDVDNSGSIVTRGVFSSGILAQSVGGGGGNGGFSTTVSSGQGVLNESLLDVKISSSSSVGASGGNGGDGGNVTVINSGNIVTLGDNSYGILAQSVGGGGGNGGSSITVSSEQGFMNNTSPIVGISIESSIGGQGGSGGNGGTVSVDNSSTIWTTGSFSSGILAQSVGGGGGTGGANLNVSADQKNLQNIADPFSAGLKMSLSIGGQSGSGNGGDVAVTNSGNIVTEGECSHGLVAQSVGGGGGLGGYIATMEVTAAGRQIPDIKNRIEIGNLDIELKGNDGSSGNGGDVVVTNSGHIVTEGEFSHGLVAQSVGGGGGLAGISNELGETTTSFGSTMQGALISQDGLGVLFAGSVGGTGSGGNVMVNNSGNIITQGDYSHGIFAQSVGGTGSGGSISVTHSGNILAEGVDSDGILVQSAGATGGGDISATILGGTVWGGSGTGTAVRFLEGSTNTLTSYGTIIGYHGVASNAIIGTGGSDTVNNYGIVTGTVDLGAGMNTFRNEMNATFNSGTIVNCGAGGMLTNAGTLLPGSQRTVLTTTLTGNFVQTGSGTFEVEVYRDGEHDKLDVKGDSASLDGTLAVARGQGAYVNGTTYDIITATDITGTFSDIVLPEPTTILSFDVNQKPGVVEVEANVESFKTVASSRVEQAIADYLDRITPTATGDLSNIIEEFQLLSMSEFGTAFASLSPSLYDNTTRTTYDVTQQYTTTLLKRIHSMQLTGATASTVPQSNVLSGEEGSLLAYYGSAASIGQLYAPAQQKKPKYGIWFNGFGQRGEQDEDDGFTGYDYDVHGVTLGIDRMFSDRYIAGISVGYSDTDIDVDRDQGDGDIDTVYGSLYGSYYTKRGYIDAVLSYGNQDYYNIRRVVIGTIEREARSDHDGDMFSAFAEGGYNIDVNTWALQPFASLHYLNLDEEGFAERGADSANLIVNDRETESLVSELGLRITRLYELNKGTLIPEVSVAWNHDFDIDDRIITTAFEGAPNASFSIEGQGVEKNGLTIGSGITLMTKGGLTTSVKYNGEFRDGYRAHGIIGELRYEF
jgi:outer membrane autotransporter protein